MLQSYRLVARHPEFIVINKCFGVSVHRDDNEHGLTAQIAADLGIQKLYLVHRLDKMTSGLLLLATTEEAAAALCQLFADRNVEKRYLALSDRKPSKKQGQIIGDMEKSRNGSWKLTRGRNNPAITRFCSVGCDGGLRLFLLKPVTGKTHQLRVALKSIGSPVLGDMRYSDSRDASQWDRGYLHAYRLEFLFRGELYRFCALPDEGQAFMAIDFEPIVAQLEQKLSNE